MRQVRIKFYSIVPTTVVVDVPDHITDDALYLQLGKVGSEWDYEHQEPVCEIIRQMDKAAKAAGSDGWGWVDWDDEQGISVGTITETETQENQ